MVHQFLHINYSYTEIRKFRSAVSCKIIKFKSWLVVSNRVAQHPCTSKTIKEKKGTWSRRPSLWLHQGNWERLLLSDSNTHHLLTTWEPTKHHVVTAGWPPCTCIFLYIHCTYLWEMRVGSNFLEKDSSKSKGKVYSTVVSPATMYGLEMLQLTKSQEEVEVASLVLVFVSLVKEKKS